MSRWPLVVGFFLLSSRLDADVWDNGAISDNDAGTRNELLHGTLQDHDLGALPGPVPDEDWYRIHQGALSSYEIVVDSTSADVGSGQGPALERIASDQTTVVQGSVPAGAGASRSLRWESFAPGAVDNQYLRVRSAGCTLTCDPQDVYRIRAYDTTYSIARLNNSATQATVLVLGNPTDQPVAGHVHYWGSAGSLIASQSFSAPPRGVAVLNTVGSAPGQSGSMTVSNDGCYGCLVGKAVAVEASTGFTFDTSMLARPAPSHGPVPGPVPGVAVQAQLLLNEVNPNIAGSVDLVELRVTATGTTNGITLVQNPAPGSGGSALLATLPGVQVAAGDLIVVHLNAPMGVITETTSQTQCGVPECYPGAWDFVGGTTGITFSDRVLALEAPGGALMDAVPFASTTVDQADYPANVQFIQAMGQWLPTDCGGQPCTYMSTPNVNDPLISAIWTGVSTTTVGISIQHAPGPDNNMSADWSLAPGTWGLPNP